MKVDPLRGDGSIKCLLKVQLKFDLSSFSNKTSSSDYIVDSLIEVVRSDFGNFK